jgi:hypothetical protein
MEKIAKTAIVLDDLHQKTRAAHFSLKEEEEKTQNFSSPRLSTQFLNTRRIEPQ